MELKVLLGVALLVLFLIAALNPFLRKPNARKEGLA